MSSHEKQAVSGTWILGCFAAGGVGLTTALFEAPFHQTSAIELGVVSAICLFFAAVGWLSAGPRVEAASYPVESSDPAEKPIPGVVAVES